MQAHLLSPRPRPFDPDPAHLRSLPFTHDWAATSCAASCIIKA